MERLLKLYITPTEDQETPPEGRYASKDIMDTVGTTVPKTGDS